MKAEVLGLVGVLLLSTIGFGAAATTWVDSGAGGATPTATEPPPTTTTTSTETATTSRTTTTSATTVAGASDDGDADDSQVTERRTTTAETSDDGGGTATDTDAGSETDADSEAAASANTATEAGSATTTSEAPASRGTETAPADECDDLADGHDESTFEYDEYGMWVADRFVDDLLARDGVRAVGQGHYPYTEDRLFYVDVAPGADVDLPCHVQGLYVETETENMWFNHGAEAASGGQIWLASSGDADDELRYPDWFVQTLVDMHDVEAYGEETTCRDEDGTVRCNTTSYVTVTGHDFSVNAPTVVNGDQAIEHRQAG